MSCSSILARIVNGARNPMGSNKVAIAFSIRHTAAWGMLLERKYSPL